jgi:hypothetical protein
LEGKLVRIREPLRRFVLGPDYRSAASTRLGPENLSPVGFDIVAARLTRSDVPPCHICGSRVKDQHRFKWCAKQLAKEAARRERPC